MYTSRAYRLAPAWAQSLMLGGRAWIRGHLREGRGFEGELQEVLQTQHLDPSALRALQVERLRLRLMQAGTEVPHYRELFERQRFDPRDFTDLAQLQQLPVLEKADVQAAGERMQSQASIGPRFQSTSSGTTGSHLVGWRDLRSIVRENAFIWRQLIWAGVKPGDRRAWLRGDKVVPASHTEAPFWRLNRTDRLLMLSSYHLTPERVPAYVEALEAYDPVALQAYPSAALFIASVLDSQGRRYGQGSHSPRKLKSIVTSSETLLPSQRSLLERVFGCRVFDWYGSFERVSAIGTCEHGRYHLLDDYGYTEFHDNPSGEDLVATGFDNRAMPLMRYRLHDRVVMATGAEANCPCSRAFPVVKAVLGRCQDVLHGLGGHRVFMPANVFDDLPGLVAGQWRQRQAGEAELLLQFRSDAKLGDAQIEAVARRYVGDALRLQIRRVSHIERTASGKLPAVLHLPPTTSP